MPYNKNETREPSKEDLEEAQRLSDLQKDQSEYWIENHIKKKAIYELFQENILDDFEVSYYLNELKNEEN